MAILRDKASMFSAMCARNAFVMHRALEERRLGGGDVFDGRRDMIVKVAAEIIELVIVARARREGGFLQPDAAFLVDRDHAPVEPFVENGARADVAGHRFDQSS